jgi:hypothetical protein
MSKELRQLAIAIIIILFTLNQIIETLGIYVPILYSYLDDLLCLPVVLAIIKIIHHLLYKNQNTMSLPKKHVVLAVCLFSIIFEGLLPKISSRFTGDVIDVLLYFVGALLYVNYLDWGKQSSK